MNSKTKMSKFPSTPDPLGSLKNQKSTNRPILPDIQSRVQTSEGFSAPSVATSKKTGSKKKHRKTTSSSGGIFDKHRTRKLSSQNGILKITNIEKDLQDRMRVRGRFPIPDAIRQMKAYPQNDENVIIHCDSLIDSAYDSEKGKEWVRNEDYITPGILSPIQSLISIDQDELNTSSDEERDIMNSSIYSDKKESLFNSKKSK